MWNIIIDNLVWFWENIASFVARPVLKVAKKTLETFRRELIDEIVKELSTLLIDVDRPEDDGTILGAC